jgi:hypothetical protein
MQMEGVEPGTNVDVDADLGRNGFVDSKVVQPLSKRNPPGIASIDPTVIGDG